MKVTVIGHWGAYPEPNEATSSYLIEVNNKKILLDCGSGALASLTNHCRLEEIDAIVLSHYHHDHVVDVFPLQYAIDILMRRGFRNRPLEIYCRKDDEYFDKISYKDACVANEITEDTKLEIENIKISFIETKHQIPCFAIKVEFDNKILVYSGDTGWFEEIIPFVENADLFICETVLFAEQKGMNDGHLASEEVGKIAETAKVKRLLMTHFPHDEDMQLLKAEVAEEYNYGELYLAEKGLTIEI